jgi:hypothetical protein
MEEKKVKTYFKQQVRTVLERGAHEPDGFRAYFENREPKDEEILGLLAVSTVMGGEFAREDGFPTPLEALAALSRASRAEICREFRKELKHCLQQLTPA